MVYLEQYRDLRSQGVEFEFFDEHIRGYLAVRYKVLRLQRSWLKFIDLKKQEES